MLAHANAAPGTVALKNVVVFVLLFFFKPSDSGGVDSR